MGFNPSDGLSVFQTVIGALEKRTEAQEFQSLGWVERLSDENPSMVTKNEAMFQSLGWVERLSDNVWPHQRALHAQFQSLGWVERLSDAYVQGVLENDRSFNPSDGLSVFQTLCMATPMSISRRFNPSDGLSVFQTVRTVRMGKQRGEFQSLGWVERLSDRMVISALMRAIWP